MCIAFVPVIASSQTTRCLGPNSHSGHLVTWTKRVVTESDTLARSSWDLPAAPADSVLLVTDSATCATVLDAYDVDLGVSSHQANRTGYVMRVENRYVVVDPTTASGGWAGYTVFDSSLAVRRRVNSGSP